MSTGTTNATDGGQYIRDYYRVPAWAGRRVIYSGGHLPQPGTITGFDGPHLRVQLDGEQEIHNYHPAWRIEYAPAAP
jgi:hypothetical protein